MRFENINCIFSLYRNIYNDINTIGELYIDSKLTCYTLEDAIRPEWLKIPGKTCIPAGSYIIELEYSPKFKCLLPTIRNVPNFTDIRIHGLNNASETLGCIGVGRNKINDYTIQDNSVLEKIIDRLQIPNIYAVINIMNMIP